MCVFPQNTYIKKKKKLVECCLKFSDGFTQIFLLSFDAFVIESHSVASAGGLKFMAVVLPQTPECSVN